MLPIEEQKSIEMMASQVIPQLRYLQDGCQLDLDSYIELMSSRGIEVTPTTRADCQRLGKTLPRHLSAYTIPFLKKTVYRTDVTAERQRFTVVHEDYHHLRPPPSGLGYPTNWLPPQLAEDLGDNPAVSKWQQSQSWKVAKYEEAADAYARAVTMRAGPFLSDIRQRSFRECVTLYGVESRQCLLRLIELVHGDIAGLVFACARAPDGSHAISHSHPDFILPRQPTSELTSLMTYMFQVHRFQFSTECSRPTLEESEALSIGEKDFVIHCLFTPITKMAGELTVLVGERNAVRDSCDGAFGGHGV